MEPDPDPIDVLRAVGWEADGEPVRITTGWDNRIWRFERQGVAYALRLARPPDSGNYASLANKARFEAAAIAKAVAGGVPAPEVVHQGSYADLPCFVQRWMPGEPLIEVARARPWQVRALGRAFGRMQARLHTLDGEGLAPLKEDELAERTGDGALLEMLREALATGRTAFCHFDYHPLNVLAEGTRITGVLDFTNAAAFDPRADIAMTEAILVAAPEPPVRARRIVGAFRRRFAAGWREGYREAAGSFPVEPAFEALAYGIYLAEFTKAVEDGRGWATRRDLERFARLREEKRAKALGQKS